MNLLQSDEKSVSKTGRNLDKKSTLGRGSSLNRKLMIIIRIGNGPSLNIKTGRNSDKNCDADSNV